MHLRSIEIGTRSPVVKTGKDFLSFWKKLSGRYESRTLNNELGIFIPMKYRKWDEQMTPEIPDIPYSQTSHSLTDDSNDLQNFGDRASNTKQQNNSKTESNSNDDIAAFRKRLLRRDTKFRYKDSQYSVTDKQSSQEIENINWQITMINEMNTTINLMKSTLNVKNNQTHQFDTNTNNSKNSDKNNKNNRNARASNELLVPTITPCLSSRMFDDLNEVASVLDGFNRASDGSITGILMVGGPNRNPTRRTASNNSNGKSEGGSGSGSGSGEQYNGIETILSSGILQDYGIDTIWFGCYPEGNLHHSESYSDSLIKLENKINFVNKHCKNYINNISLITQLCLDYNAVAKLCNEMLIESNCNEIRIGAPYCTHKQLLYYCKVCGVGKTSFDKCKELRAMDSNNGNGTKGSKDKKQKSAMFDIGQDFIEPLTVAFESQSKQIIPEIVTGIHIFDFKSNAELVL